MATTVPSNSLNNRLLWVDYARGWAILLVVYRHTMVGLERMGINVPEPLFFSQEFFMNVRMPIFFVLSGVFVSYALEKRTYPQIIGNRIRTILYPYLVWAFILLTLQILFSDFTNSHRSFSDYKLIIVQPRELDHMWYLLALFNTTLVFLLMHFFVKRYAYIILFASFVLHCSYLPLRDYSLISDIFFHLVFFAAGYMISPLVKRYADIGFKNVFRLLVISIPVFIAGQLFWIGRVNEYYEPESYLLLPVFLVITFVACWVIYLCSLVLAKKRLLKFLPSIGLESMYIYILHLPVIAGLRYVLVKKIGIVDAGIVVAASLFCGILVPIMFHRISSKLNMNFLFILPPQKHQ